MTPYGPIVPFISGLPWFKLERCPKKSHEHTGLAKANRELTAAALRILEQSSLPAFTAATYGRLTGKPGVCISTLGPGGAPVSLHLDSSVLAVDLLEHIAGNEFNASPHGWRLSRAEKIAAFPRVTNGQSLKQEDDHERSDERSWMDWSGFLRFLWLTRRAVPVSSKHLPCSKKNTGASFPCAQFMRDPIQSISATSLVSPTTTWSPAGLGPRRHHRTRHSP